MVDGRSAMTERSSSDGKPAGRSVLKRANRRRAPRPSNDDEPLPTGFERPWLEVIVIGSILCGGYVFGALALVELLKN